MYKTVLLASILLVTGCSNYDYQNAQSESSKLIYHEIKSNNFKSIDFKNIEDKQWTKVCFFGTNSNNYSSSDVLGFDWDVNHYTDVLTSSNDYNVIVFATDNKVTKHVIHKRDQGDFSKLSGKCYQRESSRFIKDPADDGGWNSYIEIENNQP